MSNLRKLLDSLRKKGCESKSNEEIIELFSYLTFEVVRSLETDKKSGKKVLASFLQAIRSLKCSEDAVKAVHEALVSLPMMLQSRWDLLAALISSQLLISLDDVLFVELMACAADQDLSVRCSSMIVQLATHDSFSERTAQIIHKGLTSPVSARRSNVLRSWLGRILNQKTSKPCVDLIIELCRKGVLDDNSATWPVSFRQISGLTCVDLEWKTVLEEESFDKPTFEILAYFSVLTALNKPTSQVKLQLGIEDEQILERGVGHLIDFISKETLSVCQIYKIYPKCLENTVMRHLNDPQIFGIVDNETIEKFSESGKKRFTEAKLENDRKEETEDHGKFYPAADNGHLKVILDLETEFGIKNTLKQFFKVQSPTEEYPSVAAVMENLSKNNIDERLFAQKVIGMIDKLVKKPEKSLVIDYLFEIITRIPLRTVVDYTGEILRILCQNDEVCSQNLFTKAMGLLETDEENTRPLSLMHCFIGTSNETRIGQVWNVVKCMKEGVKKRKMTEMLAKTIQSKNVGVETIVLYEMVLCSLHLKPTVFDFESTQLFVSAISKMFDFRSETERIMLFSAIHEELLITELINEILSNQPQKFSKSSHQMVLYMFSRFHVAAVQLYRPEHILLISRIVNYCHWCIRKFSADPMAVSIAVDAICGFLPWSYLRRNALFGNQLEIDDPVEKVISDNMRHHRFWILLSEHEKPDKFVSLENFKQLPFADLIVEIMENEDTDTEFLETIACRLLERVKNQKEYESIHANSLAFSILADKVGKVKGNGLLLNTLTEIGACFERISDPEYEVSMLFLGKALLKIQNYSC